MTIPETPMVDYQMDHKQEQGKRRLERAKALALLPAAVAHPVESRLRSVLWLTQLPS